MSVTKQSMLILVGRNPANMRGGASTWILNMDSYFKQDYRIDYLVIPEKWLEITFIPDRIKASIQLLYVLIFKRKKWDIYLSHSPELSYFATFFSKNVVHIAHGNTNPLANPTFWWGKYFYSLYEHFIRKTEQRARILFTVGEDRNGYKKINQPIRHSISPLSFDDKKNIIFAGRLEKIKNIDFLISAYSLLSNETKNSNKFHIYGRGSEEKNLKRQIADLQLEKFVYLNGHIANQTLIGEINKSALLVMASSFEGFPMVIAEALSVGTPVLSTDVGSVSNVVVNGYNGFCLQNDAAPEEYANKIEEIMTNKYRYCSHALQSSRIFNAVDVYRTIKTEMDKVFYQ